MNDANQVVIIGVGQINDRPVTPEAGLNSLELMEAALRRADADAGGDWLGRIDSLYVVNQVSFPALSPAARKVADAIGAPDGFTFETKVPMGDSPLRLLSDAANRVASGEAEVAALVGGEALRTAAHRAAAASGGNASQHGVMENARKRGPANDAEAYGLVTPAEIYPLYENATRHAWGQTLAEAQAESAAIWSGFSHVAAGNPAAWIREARTPEEILTPSASNRPISFPYNKLMIANSSVNQGAAAIVTTLARARAAGIDEARLIYVGQGAYARESEDMMARADYLQSVSMAQSLESALAQNGMTIEEIDRVELYSCFPCVPKMARRAIGWPLDKPMTVHGGLTFGGGPMGNYMTHALACMVGKLRENGGNALIFANGGYASYSHSLVISADPIPAASLPASYDFQPQADARRAPAPAYDADYLGEATIETYAVFYDRAGEVSGGTVVARNPAGTRVLGKLRADDAASIALLTSGAVDPVGTAGKLVAGEGGLREWQTA